MTYTPAPWKIAPDYVSGNTYALWDKYGNYGDTDIDTMDANARLISAAPLMLQALEAALVALGREGGNTARGKYRGQWILCRDALEKARKG